MSIIVNKNTDKFFIALGKENKHTFIMFGVYDQNQVSHLLCRVGKDIDDPVQPDANRCMVIAGRLRNVFFSKVKSKLRNERTVREDAGTIPISYQAYESTYEHYLEFIQLLESLQTNSNMFPCYKPAREDEDLIEFIKTSELIVENNCTSSTLKKSIEEFSVNNTCRHTAIRLVEEVQKSPVSPMVSSSFFLELPYRTNLVYGKPCAKIPFYVLPISPNAYPDLSDEKRFIAEKLYKRMEYLLLLEPESVQTVNKFNSLKTLYMQMIGEQKPLSLYELLFNIQSWKEQNRTTLGTLRKTYFWDAFITRECATMTMITEIEEELFTKADIAQKSCSFNP